MQHPSGLSAAAVGNAERRFPAIGYCGAVPLVVLTAWLFGIAPDHPWRMETISLLKTYAAVLLSFLGGTRWGVALSNPAADKPDPALAVLPPLLAWIAVLMPVPYAFAVLAVAFAAQGAWDSLSAHAGRLPAWFGRLRIRLTVVAVAAMVVALIATV